MGFMTGMVTGVAVAAGAAAWYLSRSGSRFRDQYRVEHRLAELGDQMERRTRELQASMNAQLTDMRSKQVATDDPLDGASAAAAEAEAATAAAEVEAAGGAAGEPASGAGTTAKPKRSPKPKDA